jgi:hypothetical protein
MTPAASPQRVIPTAAWITAAIITALSFLIITTVLEQTGVPLIARVIAPVVLPLILGGYTLLVGYVYGDARRRGMRYVMWTLLAIFLTNGIGIILYFILRDPLLAYCSRCGSNVLPACPACRRVVQPAWTHCAWCGVAFRPA